MKKIINIGIIGCGVVGLKRLSNLPKNFKIIACADPKITTIKYKFENPKILLTKDWKDLIKLKNLNAIIIATTHQLHTIILREAIKKNLHVFIEKPAGVSADKLKKTINTLKKNKFLAIRVGFNHRYHPAFIKAKTMIKKNDIGELMYIRAVYGHGGRLNYNNEWRFNKKLSGGGELIDKGSHLIDLSRFFLGNIKAHRSLLTTSFWKMNLEDNCFLILKNKRNNIAFLHASCTEWKNKFIFEIFGKIGKIEINGLGRSYGPETLTYYKMSKKMGPPKKTIYGFKTEDCSWKLELEDFYSDIIKKRTSVPGIIEAYQNLKIIDNIYKSKS
tara:strand:- start:5215 stop:6204 length:990 start_codon:yes stop_codon:yes gene_type:complete